MPSFFCWSSLRTTTTTCTTCSRLLHVLWNDIQNVADAAVLLIMTTTSADADAATTLLASAGLVLWTLALLQATLLQGYPLSQLGTLLFV